VLNLVLSQFVTFWHFGLFSNYKSWTSVTKRMKPNCQIFEKSSLNSCQAKKCQNIAIKALFETKKGHRTTFETLKYLQQTMF
jgi:hypothetical protein